MTKTVTPIGAAFAQPSIRSLVAKFNELHAEERALWAEREEREARLKVAELDNDDEALARFKAAAGEVNGWHVAYMARKDAAAAILDALGIAPEVFKRAL